MEKTLLQKAKEVKRKHRIGQQVSDEEIELFLALLKEEISFTQASTAVFPNRESKSSNLSSRAILTFREAYRRGKIIIK